ncbi:MAG TPA: MOSC N-terminal beta barrel domain-containing protein [Candidatus Saccharimonadales bacterium]|nr:MOSC N-terminal beta barrel domain-containing protein [Candidatus Saccharimonadales bacterium]
MKVSPAEKAPINAYITEVITYPVKSLPGVSRAEGVRITENGLEGDRMFTLARKAKMGDLASRLTLREYPRLSQITTEYVDGGVKLATPAGDQLLLPRDVSDGKLVQVKSWGGEVSGLHIGDEADAWLSDYVENDAQILAVSDGHRRTMAADERQAEATPYTGRATDGYPLHIASLASLDRLNTFRAEQGLDAVSIDQFRANIILDGEGLEPFAEDEWSGVELEGRDRQVRILGIRACERCVTVEVNPSTGERRGDVLKSLNGMQSERSTTAKLVFGTWAAPSLTSVGEVIQRGQSIRSING